MIYDMLVCFSFPFLAGGKRGRERERRRERKRLRKNIKQWPPLPSTNKVSTNLPIKVLSEEKNVTSWGGKSSSMRISLKMISDRESISS